MRIIQILLDDFFAYYKNGYKLKNKPHTSCFGRPKTKCFVRINSDYTKLFDWFEVLKCSPKAIKVYVKE